MGIFKRKENRSETVIDDGAINDVLLKAMLGKTSIDRKLAMTIPAVSSAVDMICNTFAMIPFKLYEESKKDGKKITKEIDDVRVNIVNYDTTDKLDGFQFKKAMCEDYLMGKGGYAFIKKKGNNFKGLFYTEEKNIAIKMNNDPIFKSYDILVNGNKYDDYNFIKLLRNTKDGASGISVTKEISKALESAYKRLEYEYDLTVTGGSRKGFIKSQKHLDDKSMTALKNAWEQYYSGNANTVILNDGMEFQEASNTSRENEINEKSKTFNDEVKEIFHIGNNYDDFIKNAIMPVAIAFATALNRDFLLEKEKKSYYFAPDLKELLKGSLKERYEAYQIAIKNGFKTRNEVRYLEDDDAIEGLDMISLGLGDVLLNAETGEIYTPNTNKLVKMGENSKEIVKNDEKTPEEVVLSENDNDLTEKGINTTTNKKTAKNTFKSNDKGGEIE